MSLDLSIRDRPLGSDVYRPLQHGCTRVLVLLPSAFGTPLSATLEAVRLDSVSKSESYEAVSYAWGSVARPRQIELECGVVVPVTESLYQALQHFRHADQVRRLWVDALCINQSPLALDERSRQVAIISDIFGAATRVLVWLGEGDVCDSLAFAVSKLRFKDWHTIGEDEWLERENHRVTSCGCCNETFALPDHPTLAVLRAVGNLLYRAWFTRVWTLQELAVQETDVTICSGFHHALWPVLADAFGFWFSYESLHIRLEKGRPAPAAMLDLQRQVDFQMRLASGGSREVSFSAGNLLEGLIMTSTRQCLDPRDRIFGMRQILGLKDIDSLRPDYNIPVSEVYRRAVVAAVEQAPDPEGKVLPLLLFWHHVSLIFGLIGTESQEPDELSADIWPSWVPKFHRLTKRSRTKPLDYPALGQDRFQAQVDRTAPQTLQARGRGFATVYELLHASVCPRASAHDINDNAVYWNFVVEKLLPWYERCMQFINRHINVASLEPRMVQSVLSANHNDDDDPAPSREEFVAQYVAHDVGSRTPGLQDKSPSEIYEHVLPHLHYNVQFDNGRQLGAVYMGGATKVAWLPPAARLGDELFWFGGAEQAVVLHSSGTSGSKCSIVNQPHGVPTKATSWMLLGDTWVDGVERDCDAYGLSAEEGTAMRIKGLNAERKWREWEEEHLEWIQLV